MKKFRLRRGCCFDVALQAVTTQEMIFTSGLDSSRALSSSSTSELQKMSYKLHPNKKASDLVSILPLRKEKDAQMAGMGRSYNRKGPV